MNYEKVVFSSNLGHAPWVSLKAEQQPPQPRWNKQEASVTL